MIDCDSLAVIIIAYVIMHAYVMPEFSFITNCVHIQTTIRFLVESSTF